MVYDYKEHPDAISRRCDNCGNIHFKSSVKDTIFLRECRKYGMKKAFVPMQDAVFFFEKKKPLQRVTL